MNLASIVVVISMMLEPPSRLRLAPIDRGLVARKLGVARDANPVCPAARRRRPISCSVSRFADVVAPTLPTAPIASAALASLWTRQSVRLAVSEVIGKTMLSARCRPMRVIHVALHHEDGARNPLGASVACGARLPVGIQRNGVIVSDTRSAPPDALPALTARVDALTAVWHRKVGSIREVCGICLEQTRIHMTRNTRFAVCCFRARFALLRCKAASRAWRLAY